ncbi:MAG: hypothetical protein SFW09_09520 [Hyphomicrobiaceae bacterium]|nr:hypothetical protein [Hyphomicrobiaceae bacterium]
MDWRNLLAGAAAAMGRLLHDEATARLLAVAGLAVILGLAAVAAMAARFRRRRASGAVAPASTVAAAAFLDPAGLGDWGGVATTSGGQLRPAAVDWPIDRVLPRHMGGVVGLAVVTAIAIWLAGLAITPSVPRFLASAEWQLQPFYMAAHIVAVRLFVLAYAQGFIRGVAHLAIPEKRATTLVRGILGLPGMLIACVVAIPFAASDFLYLFKEDYARLGDGDKVHLIDFMMWGIWSVEWFLNAFIWVVLLGFLIKNCWVIRQYPFREPIEIVLHDRHYRPFLQMSAQGSGIVLLFTFVTVGYIWYTGGAITDYAGLAITAMLLVVSFVPPWALLKTKVRQAVQEETRAMRERLLRNLDLAETEGRTAVVHNSERASMRSLEHRMDAAVAILRISYLESRNERLGATEARAIMVRMVAPAASIGWQLAKSHEALVNQLMGYAARLMGGG